MSELAVGKGVDISGEVEMRWGKGSVDLNAKNLPALKASRVLRALQNLPQGARVLDFGCGEGKILNTLKIWRPDLALFGVDIQRPLNSHNQVFSFELLEEGKVPFEAQRYDAVLALDVIEHVPEPAQTLSLISSILAPGGVFVGFVPLEGKAFGPYRAFRFILGDDLYAVTKGHIQAFDMLKIRRLLVRSFEIRRVSYSYHFLGTLFDSVFFAMMRLKSLSSWFWKSNSIYNPDQKGSGLGNRLIEFLNAVCFFESSVLQNVRLGSSGFHWVAVRRDTSSL